jgi:hypothetical protein
MRPAAKPLKSGNSVVQPYVLYIHGKPVAFAMGEQEYFEGNKEQTYGDALEATVASALRRCMKRLGIGLELWDRAWVDNFMAEQGVHVQIENKDGSKNGFGGSEGRRRSGTKSKAADVATPRMRRRHNGGPARRRQRTHRTRITRRAPRRSTTRRSNAWA